VELPLKLLLIGGFTGRTDDWMIEDREPINVDKDSFTEVLKCQPLGFSITVPNTLSENPKDEMAANLQFESLKDFGPEAIAEQTT
jgi:type VI secretion system protein ImpB